MPRNDLSHREHRQVQAYRNAAENDDENDDEERLDDRGGRIRPCFKFTSMRVGCFDISAMSSALGQLREPVKGRSRGLANILEEFLPIHVFGFFIF
jgi:hypothetical protein